MSKDQFDQQYFNVKRAESDTILNQQDHISFGSDVKRHGSQELIQSMSFSQTRGDEPSTPDGLQQYQKISMNSSYGAYQRVETSLTVPTGQLKEILVKLAKNNNFDIVDEEAEHMTIISKAKSNFLKTITSCLKSKGSCQNITVIKFHCRPDKMSNRRSITLKLLSGDVRVAKQFFADYTSELDIHGLRQITSKNTSFFGDIHSSGILKTNRTSGRLKSFAAIDEEEENSPGSEISKPNLGSYSFYEFRKILSQEEYTIGKKISEFLKDFFSNYKSVKESAALIPQPTESIFLLINETTETFFKEFNYGKDSTKKMMPFCKASVERYIFDKLYTHLFEMYKSKYLKISDQFTERSTAIIEKTSPIENLKFLDVPKKFWLLQPDLLDEDNNLKRELDLREYPYRASIHELSRLSDSRAPREKLSILLMMHSLMRSSVVEFYKGKREIVSMDEELPVMIYIMLYSGVKNIEAELALIDDYVNLDPTLESEKRLMTNIRACVQYIAKEWK